MIICIMTVHYMLCDLIVFTPQCLSILLTPLKLSFSKQLLSYILFFFKDGV